MRLRLLEHFRYAWQVLSGYRARHEHAIALRRESDIAPYVDTRQALRVLDLANGSLRPQYSILRAAGHLVYGIDLVNGSQLTWTSMAYQVARWLYAHQLGLPPESMSDGMLVRGDVTNLPFSDSYFDLVTSVAAFEHFGDVPKVVSEVARVLRPSGLVWASMHLFTSLSGGHNLSATQIPVLSLPPDIEPWDHLRRRGLPMRTPLNEWRRDQYLETFAGHFTLVKHYCARREGEHLLTPKIQAELATFSFDELTSRSYVIVGRKED